MTGVGAVLTGYLAGPVLAAPFAVAMALVHGLPRGPVERAAVGVGGVDGPGARRAGGRGRDGRIPRTPEGLRALGRPGGLLGRQVLLGRFGPRLPPVPPRRVRDGDLPDGRILLQVRRRDLDDREEQLVAGRGRIRAGRRPPRRGGGALVPFTTARCGAAGGVGRPDPRLHAARHGLLLRAGLGDERHDRDPRGGRGRLRVGGTYGNSLAGRGHGPVRRGDPDPH